MVASLNLAMVKVMLIMLVDAAAAKKPVKPSKPQALMGKKPPKFALEGNKWIIVCICQRWNGQRMLI